MKTLYLYGPPACGKSTLAKRLARECGRMYIDLDEEIERREGRTIPEIFAQDGEGAFRRAESRALRETSAPIVALGGGTLLDPENRAWAEAHGVVAVIDVDDATIAARVSAAPGTRPLGDRLAERRAHYASFSRRIDANTRILLPRKLRGAIEPPPSKSHVHRLLIARFLAGDSLAAIERAAGAGACADVEATLRCIRALAAARAAGERAATLDCGESGSTLRFFAPLAAALGIRAQWVRRGRLAERPMLEYDTLRAGVHELRGDISSQFVTGLLFALPLLEGDSEIRFATPLESRGYVDLTIATLARFGVRIDSTPEGGFAVPGAQCYTMPAQEPAPEADWSAAAFWFAANRLGSEIEVRSLDRDSAQPDRAIEHLLDQVAAGGEVDVSGCPDNYPALAAVDFALGRRARFTGTARLRLKESDRIAAMEAVFADPVDVHPCNDHRIAMAAAVLSTALDQPMLIHDADCVKKSYPRFWDELHLDLYAVTGYPLVHTRSPELHNAAHARAGRKAEMIAYPAASIDEALRFCRRCGVRGLAVTIPHKEAVMPHLDFIHPAAQAIGAVNTVVFREGRLNGYNTDAEGLREALRKFTGRDSFAGMRAMLFGAGGAAKAAAWVLHEGGAETWVCNRTPEKARELAERYGLSVAEAPFDCDLYVNATNVDPAPDFRFPAGAFVYDLVYLPELTPLVRHARACGCRAENGFSMLQAQARAQMEWFLQ